MTLGLLPCPSVYVAHTHADVSAFRLLGIGGYHAEIAASVIP
jgi:hypothetical protein